MTPPHPGCEVAAGVGALLAASGAAPAKHWERIASESRHGLWRFRSGAARRVLKLYRRDTDAYFLHRWRREERALDIVARHAPGLAPAPHGALAVPGAWAVLVMEDAGPRTLAEALTGTDHATRARLLEGALKALDQFHTLTARFTGMFRALAFQSDLDRITRTTLRRRYAIALARLADADVAIDPTAVPRRVAPAAPWTVIDGRLIAPLLQGPKVVVHNAFSPLNLIPRDGGAVVFDWETLAVAPGDVDLADLLIYPGWELTPDAMAAHRSALPTLIRGSAGRAPEAPMRFWSAAAERALTYAATAHVRARRYERAGQARPAREQQRRRDWYVALFPELAARAGTSRAERRAFEALVRARAKGG